MKVNQAANCEHAWLYAAGVCRCSKCGAYLQPNGDVTSTPTGRGGKVIDHIDEATHVKYDADDRQLALSNFLPIWDRVVTEQTDRYFAQSTDLAKPAVNQELVGQLMLLFSNVITGHVVPSEDMYDEVTRLINDSGLLLSWTTGFNKFRLLYPERPLVGDIEAVFNIMNESFSGDFIERFIEGKDNIGALLRRSPCIYLTLSTAVIDRCRTADEIFGVIRSAVQYYCNDVDTISVPMGLAIRQLGEVMQKLIITTPLKAIVVYPIMQLFHLSNLGVGIKAFELSKDMTDSVINFPGLIGRLYKAEPNDQQTIIEMFRRDKLYESFGIELPRSIRDIIGAMPRALRVLCDNGMSDKIEKISREWTGAQVESTIMTEAAGRGKVKRLKKLPADLVSYVVIEGEAIRDPNDKMLIVSYAYSKLEIIDWYIELIDVQSKRYIVPHTRDYLVNLKQDMLAAIKKIMATPIAKPGDPVININYPPGYEG